MLLLLLSKPCALLRAADPLIKKKGNSSNTGGIERGQVKKGPLGRYLDHGQCGLTRYQAYVTNFNSALYEVCTLSPLPSTIIWTPRLS